METVQEKLIGSWEMIDWVLLEGTQRLDPPFGPVDQCGGLLIYSADGMMSATLSAENRQVFADSSLDGGTDEEKIRAYESIVSYSGRYSVDETTQVVTHHVQFASMPNFVGNGLERICIFESDNILKLDTPAMKVGGADRAGNILWQSGK
ncbi:MAG: lipocalin-like domain-containing protein [Rhodococcus sp.]|nr:lipocalin-like domain-containing protein [Rhodococcus sp. (in: high G+C Gram-positive bacteria)]